jgi:hypothetical protein
MKTEKVVGAFVVVGLLFRLLLWKGGDALLVVSLSASSTLYFYFSFYFFSGKTLKDQNLAFSIIGGVFLSVVPVGILFKLMYWQGSTLLLQISILAMIVLLPIAWVLKTKNEQLAEYYRRMVLRLSLLSGIALIVYFTPMSTLLHIQYRDDAEMARLKYRSFSNPGNPVYKQELDDYQKKKGIK